MSHVVYLVVVSRTELRPRFRRVIGATSATGGNKLRHTECRGCVSVGTGDFDSLLKVSLSIDVRTTAVKRREAIICSHFQTFYQSYTLQLQHAIPANGMQPGS